MEKHSQKQLGDDLFEIFPLEAESVGRGHALTKKRSLLGRSDANDIHLPFTHVSSVHAVLERVSDGVMIFDMNSTNGTYVNGTKIVAHKVVLGDVIQFGKAKFVLKKYIRDDVPPVLDILAPEFVTPSVHKERKGERPKLPKDEFRPTNETSSEQSVYPLEKDPKAEYSEYIFEDAESLYPIFDYSVQKASVEVIVLSFDQIYSVDYLSADVKKVHLAGRSKHNYEIEFPYLGINDSVPLVSFDGGQILIHNLNGFDVLYLSNDGAERKKSITQLHLKPQELVRFSKNHLQIFVRNVESPPKVLTPPFFRRDPFLRKLFLLCLLFVGLFAGISYFYPKPDFQEEKEKAPERLATILYRQKMLIKPELKVEKAPSAIEEKKAAQEVKPEPKPVPKEQPKNDPVKPSENKGVETAKKVQEVKKGEPKAKKTKAPTPQAQAAKSKPTPQKQAAGGGPARSMVTSQTTGPVETYKSADFSSSMSSLLAKGGTVTGVAKTAAGSGDGAGSGFVKSGGIEGSGSGTVQSANVNSQMGSLVGSSTGKFDTTKGAEGIASKGEILTAGVPSETVVLGSMDPDIIRRILKEHVPQFRYCYQKELDQRAQDLSGVIRLVFTIGASGSVNQAAVEGTNLPTPVASCVVNVLRGIQFPQPLGGGTVQVKQPMNFYPKKI